MDFTHESLATPASHKCDVPVTGGGIAGVAAALATARSTARMGKT